MTGAASGHLYVWAGRNCVRSLRGHYGAVTAMFSGPYGLISGGKVILVYHVAMFYRTEEEFWQEGLMVHIRSYQAQWHSSAWVRAQQSAHTSERKIIPHT